MQRSRTRSIAFCGLSIALLAVSAMIAIPLGPVPFTLQTAILVLIICVLTPREAILTVAGYLVLGGVGLPIFSGMRGGIGVLAGPTGGFLVGFLVGTAVGVLLHSLIVERTGHALLADIVGAVALLVCSYALGLGWLMVQAHLGLVPALMVAVVPFVVPDIVKAAVAIGIATPLRRAISREPRQTVDA